METVKIFRVPIEGISLDETLRLVTETGKPFWIVTANPEILLAARRDPAYAETLRRADLRLVDGFGLWIILRLFGRRTTRVTGVELAESLIQHSIQRELKVGFIGGADGVATRAAEEIKKSYSLPPTAYVLRIHAETGGTVMRDGTDDDRGAEARMRLTQFAPDILLVAFGHPKQEMWIAKHLAEFPSVKAVVGVGGTLDYWAGTKSRAPIWMRSFGFEWLWRLANEPKRWKRIFDAVILFPILGGISLLRGRS